MIGPYFPHTQDQKNKTHTSGEKGFHHLVLAIIAEIGCCGNEENHGHDFEKVSDDLATHDYCHTPLTGLLTVSIGFTL